MDKTKRFLKKRLDKHVDVRKPTVVSSHHDILFDDILKYFANENSCTEYLIKELLIKKNANILFYSPRDVSVIMFSLIDFMSY